MSRALYRKYRSKSLGEVVGQTHVTDVLARALKQGKVSHAYLLTGPRGIGKTSIARILAHEINQLPYTDDSSHLDIIEIDAASNNGVDDVRDLREKVQLAPITAAKKIYIIDEVHMLSKPAFNALLKTLEEPPDHVVFILATTNIEKLPDTIISRTQKFGLRSITLSDATSHLKHIAKKENIAIEDAALEIIAQRGNGSFRDSISLLDQLSSLSEPNETISRELIEQTLGLSPRDSIASLLESVARHDTATIISLLAQNEANGINPLTTIDQLVAYIKASIGDNPENITLLDALLDAAASAKPEVKLLTVLLHAALAGQKPTHAPLLASTQSITAPVKQLQRQVATPKSPQKHVPQKNTEEPSTLSVTIPTPTKSQVPPEPTDDAHPENFSWETLLDYTRKNHVALHSVLSKCQFEISNDTLTLYTMRKFNKTKLDDAKYRPLLAQCLVAIGAGNLPVETVPTAPPPKDSQAAAVAALMGGGEEVTVDA